MSRNTIRRCGVLLVLVLTLGLAGATPASAEELGWNKVLGWLTGFFDLSGWAAAPGGNEDGRASGGPSRIWDMEGPGFDPNGIPVPTGDTTPTTNEGPGFDPNGLD
jgi:hypothetical protein